MLLILNYSTNYNSPYKKISASVNKHAYYTLNDSKIYSSRTNLSYHKNKCNFLTQVAFIDIKQDLILDDYLTWLRFFDTLQLHR